MHPGMVVHAGPDMQISIEDLDDKPWQLAVIHYCLPKNEADHFPLFNKHFSFATDENVKVPHLLLQLFQIQFTPGSSALFRSKLLFTNLMGELFHAAERHLATNDTILIEQVIAYILQNYAEPLAITQIAQNFGLDRRKLAFLFEHHIGMTPSNYLIECRLLKAKELLHTCNCSVKQIAECVGYSDNLYFSKAFRKKFGVSPSEFRESMK